VQSGDLYRRAEPITHPVKFYQKGDRPLEIITSRQWFIKPVRLQRGIARTRP
jgi:valyl-tRNA synthetase